MRTVGIVIYDNVEVLDACGPFEVFATTRDEDGKPLLRVLLIAERPGPVTAVGGMQFIPNVTYSSCPRLDLLVVPGGAGRKVQQHHDPTLQFVRRQAFASELVLSVCTGVFILGYARLLENVAITTHFSALNELRQAMPDCEVREERFVDAGHIITSAGISAGIDMSLHVVARLFGPATARRTALRMEYPWP